MKDLIISWNEEKGFCCEDLSARIFSDLLIGLIHKYSLKIDNVKFTSETSMCFTLQEANKAEYNIVLKDEDGSDWVFG